MNVHRDDQHTMNIASTQWKPGYRFVPGIVMLVLLLLCPGSGVHAQTTIPGMSMTQDVTLGPDAGPNPYGIAPDTVYIITGNITIHGNGQLTLETGVELCFAPGTGLYVGGGWDDPGTLIAQGTQTHPIRFTSHQATPVPGDWQCLYFDDGTVNGTTLLDWCEVEYGGHTHGSNVYVLAASPTIRSTTIRHSSAYGLFVTNGASGGSITDNVITDNASHGIYVHSGAHPTIAGNSLTLNGGHGIYSNQDICYASIEDNTIQDNGEYALSVHPNSVYTVGDNWGSGNGTNHPGEETEYDVLNIRGDRLTRQ